MANEADTNPQVQIKLSNNEQCKLFFKWPPHGASGGIPSEQHLLQIDIRQKLPGSLVCETSGFKDVQAQ